MLLKLTIDNDGLIRIGSKILPPQSLYKTIFDIAHQSHGGVSSTVCMIQREFFWPKMRHTVESMVRGCLTCCKERFQSRDTTHKWSKETIPWSRVHIDWAYTKEAGEILIIADAMTGWLEAIQCRDKAT